MLQTLFNSLFGCTHQKTTFPLTPGRTNAIHASARTGTYVACLDCGQEFAYDWKSMRIGEQVNRQVPNAEVQPTFTLRSDAAENHRSLRASSRG